VKKIVGLSTLRAQFTGILSLQLADTTTSIADADIPDNELTTSASEANNPDSATAIITVTMYTLPDE